MNNPGYASVPYLKVHKELNIKKWAIIYSFYKNENKIMIFVP